MNTFFPDEMKSEVKIVALDLNKIPIPGIETLPYCIHEIAQSYNVLGVNFSASHRDQNGERRLKTLNLFKALGNEHPNMVITLAMPNMPININSEEGMMKEMRISIPMAFCNFDEYHSDLPTNIYCLSETSQAENDFFAKGSYSLSNNFYYHSPQFYSGSAGTSAKNSMAAPRLLAAIISDSIKIEKRDVNLFYSGTSPEWIEKYGPEDKSISFLNFNFIDLK